MTQVQLMACKHMHALDATAQSPLTLHSSVDAPRLQAATVTKYTLLGYHTYVCLELPAPRQETGKLHASSLRTVS